MGGNALTHASVRLTKKNYERMAAECVDKLQAAFPGGRVHAIQAYRSKPDFGDLDVLLSAPDYDPYRAAAALDAVETVRNGPVTSVGVIVRPEVPILDGNVFQVDLISSDSQSFDFAASYFSANDLGNLVGRVAHKMGVALRHDGLVYYFRDGSYRFREIVLTRNYGAALQFLGYNADRFSAGFEDLEEIFQYVVSSPYFHRDIFLLENRNAQARVRDRKRPTYTMFLKWCEAHPELPGFEFPEDKGEWLPRIAEHFPQFQGLYDQAQTDLARQREAKAKFNGAWVPQLTGLQGQELGGLMKRIRESFEHPQALQDFVLTAQTSELQARVRSCMTTAS